MKLKRLLALGMALCILLMAAPTAVPTSAFATSVCPNHPQHDATCGYVQGESPCLHVCEKCVTPERLRELNGTLDGQIKALEQQYFGDGPAKLTPEYQEALMSLYSMIQNGETMNFSLPGSNSLAAGAATELKTTIPPGAKLNQNLKITVPSSATMTNGKALSLTASISAKVNYDVTFRWRIVNGSAKASATKGTATIKAGSTSTTITLPARNYKDERVIGETLFYVVYDRPTGAVFSTGNGYSANTRVAFHWNNGYDLSYLSKSVFDQDSYNNQGAIYDYATSTGKKPFFNLNGNPGPSEDTELWLMSYEWPWAGNPKEYSRGHAYYPISSDAADLIKAGIASGIKFKHVVYYNRDNPSGPINWNCQASGVHVRLDINRTAAAEKYYYNKNGNAHPIWENSGKWPFETYDESKVIQMESKIYENDFGTISLDPSKSDIRLVWDGTGYKDGGKYLSALSKIYTYLVDTKKPTLQNNSTSSFAAQAGEYGSGDVIPITVQFSEPVRDPGWILTVNGTQLRSQETTESACLTFLYTVKNRDNAQLTITSLTTAAGAGQAVDLNGNKFDGWSGSYSVPNVKLVTPLKELAFKKGAVSTVYPSGYSSYIITDTGRVEIGLNYNSDTNQDLTNWIGSDDSSVSGGALPRIKLSLDDGKSFYNVRYARDADGDSDPTKLCSEFPISELAVGSHTASLWIADEANGTFRPLIGFSAAVEVTQADVTDVAVTAQYGDEAINNGAALKLSELVDADGRIASMQLTAALKPERVSFPTVEWKVENADMPADAPAIAQVSVPNAAEPLHAELTLTGKAYGKVKVTATSKNNVGGVFTFSVERDISVFAGVSTGILLGSDVTARWLNSDGDAYKDAVYTVKLYRADDAGQPSGAPIGEPLISEKGGVSVVIPAKNLTEISRFKDGAYLPAYAAEVTTDDQFNVGQKLRTVVPIRVMPKKVSVQLSPKEKDINGGLFILDDRETFEFEGTIENWLEREEGSHEVEVTRNGAAYTAISCAPDDSFTGRLTIPKVEEGRLKDIYRITVKAKNNNTTLFSSDTLLLQVYDKDALKLILEDERGGKTTITGGESEVLSNIGEAAVADGKLDISTADMEEILALKRQIDLKKYMYVNYEGIGWNTVDDRMAWQSSNNDAASVNYRNGSIYDDIRNFDYTTYRPDEVMMLVGHDDGKTNISVTHGRTGNVVDFDLTVQTLKDKLYLFQVYPCASTQIVYEAYTNKEQSATETRVAATNASGEFAVYEEFGIASDVRFERSDAHGSTWLGTIFHQNLLTQEQDGSKSLLYPLNVMNMREVTIQKFFLKNENGAPYSGPVRYSYGVYKNGEFCPQARLSADKGSPEHARDKAELRSDAGGNLEIRLDSTQFITAGELARGVTEANLKPDDAISYVIEMEFGDDYTQYQPKVVEIDANVNEEQAVRSADSVLNLVSATERRAFVDSYRVQYKDEMRASYDATYNTGYVGISNEFRDVDLKSRVIWWNTKAEDLDKSSLYNVSTAAQTGEKLNQQKCSTVVYPFGYFPVTTAVQTITPELFGGKSSVDDGFAPIAFSVELYDEDGAHYASYAAPFKLTSLIGSADITDFRQNLSVGSATGSLPSRMFTRDANLRSGGTGGGGFSGQAFESGGFEGGEMANGALDGLSIGLPSVLPVQFHFTATDNPYKWKMIGLIEFSFGNDPDADALSSTTKKVQNNFQGAKDAWKKLRSGFEGGTEDIKKKWDGNVNATASVRGFVQGESTCDPVTKKWKHEFTGGGIVVSGSAGFVWSGGTFVGVVPVTYSVGAGASLDVALEFSPMSEEKEDGGLDIYTDFLSTVKFVAWIKAFGGIGFDFDIVAAKVGVFGEVNAGINVKTLTQSYLKEDRNSSYNYFRVGGEIGLKIELKLIVVEYEKVLVSGQIQYNRMDKIDGRDAYTSTNMPEKIYDSYDDDGAQLEDLGINKTKPNQLLRSLSNTDMANMQVASLRLKTEDRSYLENPSTWAGNQLLRLYNQKSSELALIGQNVYPGSEPEIARDGSIAVFRTDNGSADLNQTSVGWAKRQGDTYVKQESPVSGTIENGKGKQVETVCSNLDFDGAQRFAVAAWEQQNEQSNLAADASASYADINDMMQRTEIVTAIYRDGVWSEPLRLTNNTVSDMAPEVAVNGDKAIVVWRQPAASNPDAPTTFDVSDEIVYSYYDGQSWSETRQLDLGDLGGVKGFDVAMADDGSALMVSTVQLAGASDAMGMEGGVNPGTNGTNEITYTMIGSDGAVKGERVRLTNDDAADENPQVAYADGGFLLAWYCTEDSQVVNPATGRYETKSTSDIKLRSVGLDGNVDGSFVNSIGAVNKTRPVEVTTNFTLAQGAGSHLSDVALIWKESAKSVSQNDAPVFDKDVVYGLKFLRGDEGRVLVTAPQKIADMGDSTTADHVSAYVDGNTIRAVILQSSQTSETETYIPQTDGGATSSPVVLPKTVCSMVTASAELRDSISVSDVAFENSDIRVNSKLPVQFTVLNTGLTPINSLEVKIGDDKTTLTGLNILPNETQTVYAEHRTGDDIRDTDYTVTATFGSGKTDTASGGLHLELPDVSIGAVNVLSENKGTREMQLHLYNASDLPLKEGGYAVEVDFYDSPASDATRLPELSYRITDPEELKLIDQKGYSKNILYAIPEERLENGEIPQNGINLYIKARIVDANTSEEVEELDYLYNNETLKFETLYKDGVQFKSDAVLDNSGAVSKAVVTVKNLSLKPAGQLGNVLVSLLGETGDVLETVSLASSAGSLFDLDGEETDKRTVAFTKKGHAVTTTYFGVPDGADYENQLAVLEAGGRSFTAAELSGTAPEDVFLTADTKNLSSTLFTAVSQSPNAKLTVRDNAGQLLAEGTGSVVFTLPLTYGLGEEAAENHVSVQVTPAAEYADPLTYRLNLRNKREAGGTLLLESSAQTETGWTNAQEVVVRLTAQELANFEPVNWQYSVNGAGWTDADALSRSAAKNLTVLRDEGEHVVQGRILDAEDFAMSSDRLTVKIDRVKPVIDEDSLTFIETQQKLLPAQNGFIGFLRNLFGMDSDGNTDRQLKVRVKVTDDRSGVYDVVLRAGEMEYPMEQTGEGVYEGIVTHAFRGALQITARDLASNSVNLTTGELVIDEVDDPALGDVTKTIGAGDAKLSAGFKGTDIAEYGLQYRKDGTQAWTTAAPTAGSTAADFTFLLENLEPHTKYEYRFGHRLVTKGDMTWLASDTFTTMVKISVPVKAGDCEHCTISADMTQAWPGDIVTYTMNACDAHTAAELTINGITQPLTNEESKEQTFTYQVTDQYASIDATGKFEEKRISRVVSVPEVGLYANDARNNTPEALKEYLDGLADIQIVYDNGTVQEDYQAGWTLSAEDEWNCKGGSYTYEATVPLRSGETTIRRRVAVTPVNASITAPLNIVKTVNEETGYLQGDLGLPDTVKVVYDAETDPSVRDCPVSWTGWEDGRDGKTERDVVLTGTVALPDWATGTGRTELTVIVTDKTVVRLTNLTLKDKVYDGETLADYTIDGVIGLEAVEGDYHHPFGVEGSRVVGTPVIHFLDQNAGTQKGVGVTGLAIEGENAAFFRLDYSNLRADITPREITVTGLEAVDRDYDFTNIVELQNGTVNGILDNEKDSVKVVIPATGQMEDDNAGTGKKVTATLAFDESVDETARANYFITQPDDITVNISPLAVGRPEGLIWVREGETKIRWNAVEHASGYRVQFYKNGELFGSPVLVEEPAFDCESIIEGKGQYSFTVQAMGEGNFTEGETSERSPEILLPRDEPGEKPESDTGESEAVFLALIALLLSAGFLILLCRRRSRR